MHTSGSNHCHRPKNQTCTCTQFVMSTSAISKTLSLQMYLHFHQYWRKYQCIKRMCIWMCRCKLWLGVCGFAGVYLFVVLGLVISRAGQAVTLEPPINFVVQLGTRYNLSDNVHIMNSNFKLAVMYVHISVHKPNTLCTCERYICTVDIIVKINKLPLVRILKFGYGHA